MKKNMFKAGITIGTIITLSSITYSCIDQKVQYDSVKNLTKQEQQRKDMTFYSFYAGILTTMLSMYKLEKNKKQS
ncbi:hypothetical protein K9L67_00385 [Candidatus Woesearchaeota archaeon]|nr:hypothetical protein [Candidatus Woesearchaeota archaeon]MCF7900663.1 hypothetical protein [Candidatus Woesearchaeota archaeon]MCF8013502.1 hypothetical protein [Candidatus Woesearchaeota archaeon]